jgi:aminopeptidase N
VEEGAGRDYRAMDGDIGDSSADETNNLVLSESHPTASRKKYVVSSASQPRKKCFSRNEWICVLVGVVVVVVVLLTVVLGIGVWAGLGRGASSSSSSSSNNPWKNVRLPSDITPEDYTIHLAVNIEQFTVTGSTVISLNITKKTRYILIHVKEMNVSCFRITQNGETIPVKSNFTYEENNFYVLSLASSLATGEAVLEMEYYYPLGDGLVGFYRSSYRDSSGETHWIATTHFEPTDARKAFPCFDEPAMKANFTISITHSSELNAHSNMPVREEVSDEEDGSMVTTFFETSVKMSTYLVAFVVSDFECITRKSDTVYQVNVSVCSNREVLNNTHYALEKASEILKFYETYFAIPYPLPKQDLFAIPDFAAGAMENWGLITYRETALLYDPAVNPETSKQRVAVVIAHELAHQWFGNLVTMEWWDGLWLNEGFATFTEYIGTDATEPSFHMLEEFLTYDVFPAFSADGVNESHPIIETVSNPDEINELFDSISYSKGGSVLRMIRNVLTPEKFQQGISQYLEKSKFGNAKTQQLWDALQTVVDDPDLNVTEIMNTWTLQMGYPVLHVDTKSGQVTQERFFILKPNGTVAPSPYE